MTPITQTFYYNYKGDKLSVTISASNEESVKAFIAKIENEMDIWIAVQQEKK